MSGLPDRIFLSGIPVSGLTDLKKPAGKLVSELPDPKKPAGISVSGHPDRIFPAGISTSAIPHRNKLSAKPVSETVPRIPTAALTPAAIEPRSMPASETDVATSATGGTPVQLWHHITNGLITGVTVVP